MLVSTKELASKWGVDPSRVLRLVRKGRIEGARLIGKSWMFPADAIKPDDGRTKAVRAGKHENICFRFPLYVNFKPETYSPSLSNEEMLLREAQIAFHACQFTKAKDLCRQEQPDRKDKRIVEHFAKICLHQPSPPFRKIHG